jgi:hypothetical protein
MAAQIAGIDLRPTVEKTMSKSTIALGAQAPAAQEKSGGFFGAILSAMIAWREAEAQRIVDSYLATLSDERLREPGHDPAAVRARAGRGGQFSAWS